MRPTELHAVVVHESMFGNTAAIAAAVTTGLRQRGISVTVTDVAQADPASALHADLLVVGAPTHAFSLSRPRTRADAVAQGAASDTACTGLREWLQAGPSAGGRYLAAFDTRVDKVRALPFGAAPAAARIARRRGFKLLGRPMGFAVTGTKGPLCEGETERASEWGRALAREATARCGAAGDDTTRTQR